MNANEINQLANQLKRNNVVAYNTLFKQYYKPLSLFSNGFVYDLEAAKDIVQDVFIKLWLQRFALKEFENFESYIYKSVKNSSLDYLKKLSNRNKYEANLIDVVSKSQDLELDQEFVELEEILRNEIEELPPVAKKVFNLKNQELKHDVIAQRLSVSKRAVDWHMAEIRKKIKKSIKNYLST
jgi:RNA polymerase sigma-70 factor (ECF subfamily)